MALYAGGSVLLLLLATCRRRRRRRRATRFVWQRQVRGDNRIRHRYTTNRGAEAAEEEGGRRGDVAEDFIERKEGEGERVGGHGRPADARQSPQPPGWRPAAATKTHGAEYWGGLHFSADFTRRWEEEHLHKFGYFAPSPPPPSPHRFASHSHKGYGKKVYEVAAQLPNLDSIRPQNATGRTEEKRRDHRTVSDLMVSCV